MTSAPEYVMKGSGRNQKIVYEAVKHERIREEMERLLSFVNEKTGTAAFRDIQHLVGKGLLIPSDDAGKNRGYFFNATGIGGKVSF